jgi:hypothetical protein
MKKIHLTFLTGIYHLTQIKLADTDFLMPRVSKKKICPFVVNIIFPYQSSNNAQQTTRKIPKFAYDFFESITGWSGGYS